MDPNSEIVSDFTHPLEGEEMLQKPLKVQHIIEESSHWLGQYEEGQPLSSILRTFWKNTVPLIYQVEGDSVDWGLCEEEPAMFNALEKFICGNEDVDLQSMLKRLGTPPLCGRVFKFGEPTYFCRECGIDGTCVFCATCFKNSVHQHHKYKMGKSPGGGRCDCGDVEAWHADPYCDIHRAGMQQQDQSSQLPPSVVDRARNIFDVILSYAFDLLTLKYTVSLPPELKRTDDGLLSMDLLDTYCLVVYNDEAHTFEQVFEAMNKVMKNDPRDMNEMVTRVDREGRAVVKVSNFQHCTELRSEMEKCTSRQSNPPIKVQVLNVDVVAHQIFAIRLLEWLEHIVQRSEGFRTVFASVAFATNASSYSIVERVVNEDATMWKSARTTWHHLFMSGLLMEYESKKALACLFTAKYGHITKEYIRDDHDRHVSISSLSVQLFTVPTLALYLIAEKGALHALWNTFLSECSCKVRNSKLVFERNSSNVHFRRAMDVLSDIKFLLGVPPTSWTDALRKGFLQGLSSMVTLMGYMQGMDPVQREVGQHVEYEPEWETGFVLHMRVASIATQVIEWCGTDKVVLIKAYRLLLSKLNDIAQSEPNFIEAHEVADHSASCYTYDVASRPVSIHLPMHRMLAGLHLHLEKYGLSFDSQELQMNNKPTPLLLIEPVLRLHVMVAQVHSGMWRRNGYSLLTQITLYHGVKCRTEMLDRDIVLLQIGASLIESNEFLIMLLHKFNLLHWASPAFEQNPDEESMRKTINLVEEFMGLLVTLIGERFTPGVGKVTEDDHTRKELIQQLCIRPFAHSEIYSTFPYEERKENRIESILDEVAVFKKPTNRKGFYELKEELHSEYNVFYYHYTREERSKSEEQQRKRNKSRDDTDCCPPPHLPTLTDSFAMLTNLLQCDVMLHILDIVLTRATNLRAQSFSEMQVHKALHLIGYALQEQEKDPEGYMLFTERAERWRIERNLEVLSGSARVEALKGMIKWVLNKYRAVKKSRQPRSAPSEPVATQSQAEFLAGKDKEWRAKMAAEKRAKIMAQMMAMQKNFMKENATMFQAVDSEKGEEGKGMMIDVDQPVAEDASPVALGPGQTRPVLQSQTYTCILCQEDETVSCTGPTMVLAAYVQKSAVLSRQKDTAPEMRPLLLSASLSPAPFTSTCGHVMHASCWKLYYDNVKAKESRRPYRLRQPTSFDIEFKEFLCPLCGCLSNSVLPLVPALPSLVPSSSKSSSVSFKDWIVELKTGCLSMEKETHHGAMKLLETLSKPTGEHVKMVQYDQPIDLHPVEKKRETRPLLRKQIQQQREQQLDESDSLSEDEEDDDASSSDSNSVSSMKMSSQPGDQAPASEPAILSEDLANMILTFAAATFDKSPLPVQDEVDDMQIPIVAWRSCAYTIHSFEALLRDEGKPLLGHMSFRQHDCLQSLVRMMALITTSWRQPNLVGTQAFSLFTLLVNTHPAAGSVLDWDSFGMLVPVVFLLAKRLIPTGNDYELHGLRLSLFAELIKFLLSVNPENGWNLDENSMEVDEVENVSGEPVMSQEDVPVLRDLLKLVRSELQLPVEVLPSPKLLWDRFKEHCRPFLRCAVIFFHFLTSVPEPAVLTTEGGDTFENMCSYLGLKDSWKETFFSDTMQALAVHWLRHPRIPELIQDKDCIIRDSPLRIKGLVQLPEDYSELMNSVSEFHCRKGVASRNPTMCLVCGEMLCSQNYCCQRDLGNVQVGACTYHAAKCGAGCGLFLRVRECEVLLLALPNRGTFMTSPYVDDYGETDQGLRRGNRLRLCPELYRNLELLWLSHGIREYISRSIDRGAVQIMGQWHQF